MEIKKIMVVGAGQMGAGIAQVAAKSGIEVVLNDVKPEFVARGISGVEKRLEREVSKERMDEDEKKEIMTRILPSTFLGDAKDCDLVIEAVIENMDIKREIFSKLDLICPAHTILASNTSALPVTEIGNTTKRPEKVIGMHFMNPVPLMKLVEIIRGLETAEDTYESIYEFALKLDKSPVAANDAPGFISNRILLPMINEAIFCLFEGVGEPEDIDRVLMLGMNHRMGPLALADLIGLDTCLYIMEVLYDGFKDTKYRPCPLLRKYVNAGRLGVKTGRGFYIYNQATA